MAQEAQVQHTTPTEAATHPPGTMTPKLNASKGKKDAAAAALAAQAAAEEKALKNAAEAAPGKKIAAVAALAAEAAAEEKARKIAAEAAPGGAEAPGGTEAAETALTPPIAVEDTVVDQEESQDETPLTELTKAPKGDAAFPLVHPPFVEKDSGQDGQQQESPESLYQRTQQQSPDTQAPEACPPPLSPPPHQPPDLVFSIVNQSLILSL